MLNPSKFDEQMFAQLAVEAFPFRGSDSYVVQVGEGMFLNWETGLTSLPWHATRFPYWQEAKQFLTKFSLPGRVTTLGEEVETFFNGSCLIA